MSTTSIGAGSNTGGNENHGSDGQGNKTLGEQSSQVPPTGKQAPLSSGAPFPDGPNVGPSAGEKDAAQGKQSRP